MTDELLFDLSIKPVTSARKNRRSKRHRRFDGKIPLTSGNTKMAELRTGAGFPIASPRTFRPFPTPFFCYIGFEQHEDMLFQLRCGNTLSM